ncbi:MAG: WecB/TagA/CpsF family glycosyltransferase [Leptolyngbyaceae cyanobacterium CSU_1_3]|nr:WecB/TagA/CpsF family glycosyltransferase [Leptolyngbyaceae cyanobacterium CSU_1_3]
MRPVDLLNISVDRLTLFELLGRLRFGGIVFTPNVDHLIKLQKDQDFYQAYQIADYRVCDSQILLYAAQFLGVPIPEKISGSDLFPAFYQYYKNDSTIKIFLLGAKAGVAEQAKRKINLKMGRPIVVDTYAPSFGFENNLEECQKIVCLIQKSGATVLAIGVGAPKQEKWIAQYKDQLETIKIFLAIGATIDFEAGQVGRSPRWMSEVGLEWLYRICCEPKRLWKRYIVDDLPFFWLILKQWSKLYRNPWAAKTSCKIHSKRSLIRNV